MAAESKVRLFNKVLQSEPIQNIQSHDNVLTVTSQPALNGVGHSNKSKADMVGKLETNARSKESDNINNTMF